MSDTPTQEDIELLQTQATLANQISSTLNDNVNYLNTIGELLTDQTSLITQLNESINVTAIHFQNITNELEKTHEIIDSISKTSFSFLSSNILQSLNGEVNQVSDAVLSGSKSLEAEFNSNAQRNKEFLERQAEYSNLLFELGKQQKESADGLTQSAESAADAAEDTKNASIKAQSCIEKGLNFIKNSAIFIAKTGTVLFRGAAHALQFGKNILGGFFSTLTGILKAVTALPFTIAKLGATVGNELRKELVEGLGQTFEDLKEKFDMSSFIGKNITSMKEMSEKLMIEFYRPNSELVKYFGYGNEGLKKYLSGYGKIVEDLGMYSEVYAGEIRKAEQHSLYTTKAIAAAGLTAEDVKYFGMEAYSTMSSFNEVIHDVIASTKKIKDEFGFDFKQQSKRFMQLRKDIVLFGHLSNDALNTTAATMTKMGVRIEDAAAVFNKFSTFEQAANSVAILGQTFGMNLNAMDLIKAEKPEEIFGMFRNAMLDTGRTFDELSRFEKNIMVQQTGMSAESLKAMMNYSAAGLTIEEAREAAEENSPEKRQLNVLKQLRSTIKEFKKTLSSNSFFDAFTDGIMTKMTYHKETRETVMALSKGYQGLYEYATKIDPETIVKLVRPVRYVIDTMERIFKSDAFKNGVISLLKAFGNLMNNAFEITAPEKAFQDIKSKLKSIKVEDITPAQRTNIIDEIKHLENELKIAKPRFGETSPQNLTHADLDYLISLYDRNDENALDGLKRLRMEAEKKDKSDAGFDVAQDLQNVVDLQEENVGILAGLTQKIVKALVIGAMTGVTALLKTLNKQLKENELNPDDAPSLLSIITGMDKKEAQQLTSGLWDAISGLFSEGNAGGIGLFLVKQMTLMLKDLAFFFADILFIAIKGAFGEKLDITDVRNASTAERMLADKESQTSMASLRAATKPYTESVSTGDYKKEYVSVPGTDQFTQQVVPVMSQRETESSMSKIEDFDVKERENMLFRLMKLSDTYKFNRKLPVDLKQSLEELDIKKMKQRLINVGKDIEGEELTLIEANRINTLFNQTLDALKAIEEGETAKTAPPVTQLQQNGSEVTEANQTSDGPVAQGTQAAAVAESVAADLREDTVTDSQQLTTAANTKRQEIAATTLQLGTNLAKLSEQTSGDQHIFITPTFDTRALQNLAQSMPNAGLWKYMTDPSYNQGRYYPSLELSVHPSGHEATYNPQQTKS